MPILHECCIYINLIEFRHADETWTRLSFTNEFGTDWQSQFNLQLERVKYVPCTVSLINGDPYVAKISKDVYDVDELLLFIKCRALVALVTEVQSWPHRLPCVMDKYMVEKLERLSRCAHGAGPEELPRLIQGAESVLRHSLGHFKRWPPSDRLAGRLRMIVDNYFDSAWPTTIEYMRSAITSLMEVATSSDTEHDELSQQNELTWLGPQSQQSAASSQSVGSED